MSDQVYRVARRLVGSREEADDLVQQTYERAFRSWRQYTPGHEPARLAAAHPHEPEHRPRAPPAAHAADHVARQRGRRLLPLQQARVAGARREPGRGARARAAQRRTRSSRRSPTCRTTSATRSCSSTSASSPTPTPRRSSTSRSAPSCRGLHRGRRILKQNLADRRRWRPDRMWCDKCEEMMQPFLDGTLSDDEVAEAQRAPRELPAGATKRYHFEERLRHYVRVAVDGADAEPERSCRSSRRSAYRPVRAGVRRRRPAGAGRSSRPAPARARGRRRRDPSTRRAGERDGMAAHAVVGRGDDPGAACAASTRSTARGSRYGPSASTITAPLDVSRRARRGRSAG